MMSSRFDPGSTSKILNLSLLRFNERFGFENLGGEHLNLLDEFLLLCLDSIIDVTMRNETVLHIALKFNRLEAFKFFTGWLANNSSENAEFN